MKFWVDPQLPPALATWLAERFKVDALSLRDIGLRDAPDMEIFRAAQQAGIVVISKDSDFVELVSRYGTPPQLVWVTCGNVSNRSLMIVFEASFSETQRLLESGESIVELG